MLKFMKGFLKENRKIAVANFILTILLVLMFQHIMGQRREYIDTSREPDKTENSITIEGENVFLQQVVCEKDTIDGIMVLGEMETGIVGTVSVQVFEESGKLLAQATQQLRTDGDYTMIQFGESISGCTGKNWNWFYVLIVGKLSN